MWLVVIGFVNVVARLSNIEEPVLATIGQFLSQAPAAGVIQLLLLFPSGRLRGRFDRVLVALSYAIAIGFAVGLTLARPPDLSGAVRVGSDPGAVELLSRVQQVCWFALLVVTVVVLARRMRVERAVGGERRARRAVYVAGIGSVVLLPLAAQFGPAIGWSDLTVFVVQVVLVALVPVVFALSLLVGGYARTGDLEELAASLGTVDVDRSSLRDELARTLGDDSLQLLFHRPYTTDLVDAAGAPVAPPRTAASTGVVTVGAPGAPGAVIAYDTAAVADPRLVEAAGRVVSVAVDRDRLTQELLAEREALHSSRARLVRVADAERRRLSRDLHDGVQGRLVLVALRAGMLEVAEDAAAVRQAAGLLRSDLEDAITELRRVVHGMLPALLVERGLVAAARDLAERCPLDIRVRLPEHEPALAPTVASTAYFVLAEAMTNALKHAQASRLELSIDADAEQLRLRVADDGVGATAPFGVGLSGLTDRVEALDGLLEVRAGTPSGTTVVAVIPVDAAHRVAT